MCSEISPPVACWRLCGTFVFAILVAIYGLIAEKTIAIEFARKELVGTRYLETIRGLYGAADRRANPAGPDQVLAALASAETDAAGKLQTAELNQQLVAARVSFRPASRNADAPMPGSWWRSRRPAPGESGRR